MNPFYFGPSARPLFGVYSQARNVSRDGGAVLLCYPILGEYLRAHRAFRQLNNLLNRAGVSVLRFDYSCTGDSSGSGEEARLDTWIEDVGWAVDELRDMVGVDRVSIVGLRFGATLAVLAARERDDVRRMVLWDPIVSGEAFVTEATRGRTEVRGETLAVEGIPLTTRFRAELEGVDLRTVGGVAGRATDIVVSGQDAVYQDLARSLQANGEEASVEVVPSSGNWTEADPFGSAYIPDQIIRTVVDKLTDPAGASA